jgi:uncharacterized protein (TIGR02996 family)
MSDGLIEGFEAHLREEPDDLATWSAYADYLTEQGDPRGEFMAVQIALERETPPAERIRLKKREAELVWDLDRWLGPELSWAVQRSAPGYGEDLRLTFRRGWLQGLVLDFDQNENYSAQIALNEALAAAPTTRWVLSLTMDGPDRTDVSALADAPFLPVLRRLHIGGEEENSYADRFDGDELVVANAPRLESVTFCLKEPPQSALLEAPRPYLRELVIGCAWEFGTARLAKNTSLRNLRTLRLVPGCAYDIEDEGRLGLENLEDIANAPQLVSLTELRFSLSDAGDAGIEVLIRSGLLQRLEVLDLSYGNVTDTGAAALVAALTDRSHRLRVLNLSENALTEAGIATLRTLGFDLHVGQQHDPDSREYLYNGNME